MKAADLAGLCPATVLCCRDGKEAMTTDGGAPVALIMRLCMRQRQRRPSVAVGRAKKAPTAVAVPGGRDAPLLAAQQRRDIVISRYLDFEIFRF